MGALLRQVGAAGGFASVLHKGERDAGTILLVLTERGAQPRAYERMPQADGTRRWHRSAVPGADDPAQFDDWLDRRGRQDPDLWIVELDIANGERFIGLTD